MKRLILIFSLLAFFAGTSDAVSLLPLPKQEFRNAAGSGACSGCLIYTYEPGSTTPKTSFTDSTGLIANEQPVETDSAGRASIWGDGCYKLVSKTSSGVTIATQDNVCEYQTETAAVTEWVSSGLAPTYISGTSFSVSGDHTTDYFASGRRLKTTNTGGTIYSTVASSSYGASITTVTVVNDSGTIDSGISAVSAGLLDVTSPSAPIQLVSTKTTGYTILPTDMGKILIANLTSAATFTLPAASAVPSGSSLVTKNTSTWTLTIAGTVDGEASPTLATQNYSRVLFSDGSAWRWKNNFATFATSASTATIATTATTANRVTDGTNNIKFKMIDLGDWNMTITDNLSVTHGLTLANIRNISGMIRNDAGTVFYPITTGYTQAAATIECSIRAIDSTIVSIEREPSAFFTGANFDDTSYNRGWLTISYVE